MLSAADAGADRAAFDRTRRSASDTVGDRVYNCLNPESRLARHRRQ
jgi:hypothetical protein